MKNIKTYATATMMALTMADEAKSQYPNSPNFDVTANIGTNTDLTPRTGLDMNIGKLNTGLTYAWPTTSPIQHQKSTGLEARIGRNLPNTTLYGVTGLHLNEKNHADFLYGAGLNIKLNNTFNAYTQITRSQDHTQISAGLKINIYETRTNIPQYLEKKPKRFIPSNQRTNHRTERAKRQRTKGTFIPSDKWTNKRTE